MTSVASPGRGVGRGVATIACLLLLTAASIWCVQTIRKAERSNGNDLVAYLAASDALYAGEDPYHLPNRFPYIYPLFLAAIVRPLAALDVRSASVLWFLLQCACFALVVNGARFRAHGSVAGWAVLAALLAAVFGDVLQSEFLNGQVNLLVVALAVAAVGLGDSHQRAAAMLLGAAIALKLTPAIVLAYWWMRGRYVSVGEAIAWAAAFILAPWLIVQGRLWPLYSSYLHEFIVPRTRAGDQASGAVSFNVYGFWGWLTGSPAGYVATVLLSVAVLSGVMIWHWRLVRRPVTVQAPAAWLYLALMPLLSPMSEVHHLTALLPAATFASGRAMHAAGPRPGVAALLALFVVLLWVGRFDRNGPWYFFATLVLVVAAAIAVRSTPGASSDRSVD